MRFVPQRNYGLKMVSRQPELPLTGKHTATACAQSCLISLNRSYSDNRGLAALIAGDTGIVTFSPEFTGFGETSLTCPTLPR